MHAASFSGCEFFGSGSNCFVVDREPVVIKVSYLDSCSASMKLIHCWDKDEVRLSGEIGDGFSDPEKGFNFSCWPSFELGQFFKILRANSCPNWVRRSLRVGSEFAKKSQKFNLSGGFGSSVIRFFSDNLCGWRRWWLNKRCSNCLNFCFDSLKVGTWVCCLFSCVQSCFRMVSRLLIALTTWFKWDEEVSVGFSSSSSQPNPLLTEDKTVGWRKSAERGEGWARWSCHHVGAAAANWWWANSSSKGGGPLVTSVRLLNVKFPHDFIEMS